MKRIKSILTVLMAAVFALSLVSAGAWAASAEVPTDDPINAYDTQVQGADPTTIANHNTNGQTGVLGTQHGTMTIANAKANETYKVYRLFELASFDDEDTSTGVHGTNDQDEAYNYVIDMAKSGSTYTNKWVDFLLGQGPTTGVPYAVLSKASDNASLPSGIDENNDGIITPEEAAKKGVYFVIDSEPIAIKGADGTTDVTTYHHVAATSKFSNAWDDPGAYTSRTDSDGNPVGVDYTQQHVADDPATDVDEYKPGYGVVQDFAKAALSYATTQGIAPNYVETGVGKPNTAAEGETANDNNGSVTVNARAKAEGATSYDAEDGTDYDGTSEVPLGYYLVGTTMGTLASLDTTNSDVTIYDKNDEPKIDKAVLKKGSAAGAKVAYLDLQKDALYTEWQRLEGVVPQDTSNAGYIAARQAADAAKADYDAAEAATGSWVENTDADNEDYVMFRTVIYAQQGARDYRLHDVMEPGLELVTAAPGQGDNWSVDRYTDYTGDYLPKVYLVRGTQAYELAATQWTGGEAHTNWKLVTGGRKACGHCDFEVWFRDGPIGGTSGEIKKKVTFKDAEKKVTFKDAAGNVIDVKDGDKIVLAYWCHVDSDEVVWGEDHTTGYSYAGFNNNVGGETGLSVKENFDGDGRDDNYTLLTYGDKSFTTLEHASVTEYKLQLAKTDAYAESYDGYNENEYWIAYWKSDSAYKLLDGAEFKLYKASTTDTHYANPDPAIGTAGYRPLSAAGEQTYWQESDALRFTFDADNDDTSYTYVGDEHNGTESAGTETTIVTTESGAISLFGLEAGDYILVETKAPEGYNKLAHPIVITIKGDGDGDGAGNFVDPDADDTVLTEGNLDYRFLGNDGSENKVEDRYFGTYCWDGVFLDECSYFKPYDRNDYQPLGGEHGITEYKEKTDHAAGGIHIINQTGQELPSTGGIGTTIFYVAGTVLVVGAAVMLVAKRRMGAEA